MATLEDDVAPDGETGPDVDGDATVANPTLYSETYSMTFVSSAIFAMADVREAARSGKIDAPEVIALPVKVPLISAAFLRNTDVLQRHMKKADFDFLLALTKALDSKETIDGKLLQLAYRNATIHYFGDDDSKTESVYVLIRNPYMRRILLCFRGSITITDWIKDAKVLVGNIENPLHIRPDQPAELGVHLGFREYLYSESRNGSMNAINDNVMNAVRYLGRGSSRGTDADVSGSATSTGQASATSESPVEKQCSRLSRIIQELTDLRVGNEDYSIYVTGHSLGGALALLTSLEVAALFGRVGNPVTFVGVGNPRAATVGFRGAVETLEREGKMRCLGVHNKADIVPMIPTSTLGNKRQFCQVGFEMLLDDGKCEMLYCPKSDDYWKELRDKTARIGLALFRADKIAGRHHYMTYLSMLKALEAPLSKLHLNDYYNHVVKPDLLPGSSTASVPTHVTGHTV
jgi:hypothetical protein